MSEIHIVNFSGGRTSAYLTMLINLQGKENGWDVRYVFMDTGAEHPKTYEFIKKCVKFFDIDLVCLRPIVHEKMGVGMTYEEISIDEIGYDLSVWNDMTNKYGNPYNPGGGFCTDKLKTVVYRKYIKQFENVVTWIGIRADEQRRLKEKKGVRYLADISDKEKADIIGWWGKQPFDLEIQEHLGNCVFCIKRNPNKIALAIKDEPELMNEWVEMTKTSRIMNQKDGIPNTAMYRGKLSILGIKELYKDMDRDELHMSLRHAKKFESGSCSESCEVFANEDQDE